MDLQGLKEWAPLTDLLDKIPLKVGLLKDLNLTCVSSVAEFIALGTDCGLLLWYNRKKNKLEKLRTESSISVATCIQIVDTVDWMVAAGDEQGRLTIFQIEKDHAPELGPIAPKTKPIERFTIAGCHAGPVTCVQWSKNGMKLFSGDKAGKVILTEINYQAVGNGLPYERQFNTFFVFFFLIASSLLWYSTRHARESWSTKHMKLYSLASRSRIFCLSQPHFVPRCAKRRPMAIGLSLKSEERTEKRKNS